MSNKKPPTHDHPKKRSENLRMTQTQYFNPSFKRKSQNLIGNSNLNDTAGVVGIVGFNPLNIGS
jgi:hypothetical protein